jgi:hypothetical protein
MGRRVFRPAQPANPHRRRPPLAAKPHTVRTNKKTARRRSCDRGADYILSSVFFIFVDLDLAIFFLLILSFDISPFDVLSLWAAGPVVAGLLVSVDWAIAAEEKRTMVAAVSIVFRIEISLRKPACANSPRDFRFRGGGQKRLNVVQPLQPLGDDVTEGL